MIARLALELQQVLSKRRRRARLGRGEAPVLRSAARPVMSRTVHHVSLAWFWGRRHWCNEWSGLTLGISEHHLIVVNTAQSPRRQNSVLMHELAHIMLGHQFRAGTISSDGHFVPANYDQDQEDEAAWLGATLLVPRPALLWMRRERVTNDQAATYFGVSPDLLNWRIRMTGIDYQLSTATRR